MSESKFNPRTMILLLIIIFVSIIRVAAPFSGDFKVIANFSAVGAIALFGGAYFNNNVKAFAFPLLILLLSDLFIAKNLRLWIFLWRLVLDVYRVHPDGSRR